MHQATPRRRHATGIALGMAVLLAVLTGCSASHGQAPAAHSAPATAVSTAAATPTASSTLDPAAQQALAAYETSWHVADAASRTGRYEFATLSQYFAGDALTTVTQNLDAYAAKGIVSRGAIVLHPYVVGEDPRSNPPTVAIADCVDDRNDLLYYAATGKPIDNVPGGFRAETTVMSDLNGTWKASEQAIDAEGTCKLR